MKQIGFKISIIIPCRNEEKYIAKCLDSIISQDYPKENLEVLVVDGMSEDNTREIVKKYAEKSLFIKLLDNPKKFTNFAFNIGVKAAKGEIVMIMGAHAGYEKDYVSKCVKYLKEYNADNVGGIMKTMAKEETIVAKAIALSMSHFFGTGGVRFRTGSKEVMEVDTVFGGCYKREVFNKIGLFNEKLHRSQDMEFNIRLKRAGGKIILAPDIVNYYYPKSNFKDFLLHSFDSGFWSIYPSKFTKKPLKLRHYIPLLFILGIMGTLIFGIFSPPFFTLFLIIVCGYLLFNLYFSAGISIKEREFKYFLILPLVFVIRHFGYGFGSLWGLLNIWKTERK